MKKLFIAALSFAIVIAAVVSAFGVTIYVDPRTDPNVITSKDGKYGYYLNDNEATIVISYEDDITVFNFPEEVDRYKVVNIREVYFSSANVTRINFSKNAKDINRVEFASALNKPASKICTFILSPNIEYISNWSSRSKRDMAQSYDTEYSISLKALVFPQSLQRADNIFCYDFENVVFEGNPQLSKDCFTRNAFLENQLDEDTQFDKCNIYYAGEAFGTDESAFDYIPHELPDTRDDITEKLPIKSGRIHIFKKPEYIGKDAFESKYPAMAYNDEWWKNIKEIQSVTLSGKGLRETKDSPAHGTITNLGWSASNDPLQYLSHKYSLDMSSGEKVKLTSTFAPSDAFDDRMFFVSLNEDVAKVDVDSGEITALKKGAATVRCVAASGVFSDVIVYVDGATAADLPDDSAPAATATTANPTGSDKTVTAVTPDKAANDNTFMEKIKSISAKPAYIAVPACTLAAAAAVVVLVIKKRKR